LYLAEFTQIQLQGVKTTCIFRWVP
jgi:hypothetical protein